MKGAQGSNSDGDRSNPYGVPSYLAALTSFGLNAANDAVFLADDKGQFLFVNDQACRSLGYTHEEFLELRIPDINSDLPPNTRISGWGRLKREGVEVSETHHRHKDGHIFPVEITSNYFEFDGREFNLAFVHDLSARRANQKQIQLLFRFMDKVMESVILMEEDSPLFTYVNESAARNLGYSQEELTNGMGVFDIDPTWDAEVWEKHRPLMRNLPVVTFESVHRRRDGHTFPVEVTGNNFEFEGTLYSLAICKDITERKRADAELLRKTRALELLSESNQALVRIREEHELLDNVCRAAVEVGGYRLAWVGWAVQDEQKSISPAARYGADDGFVDSLNLTWAEAQRGQGPGGRAIRSGKPSVVQDVSQLPVGADGALARGLKAVAALPLVSSGTVLGALFVYAGELEAFDNAELAILSELADDLAFGISSIRLRERHALAEQELHLSLAREAEILESITDMFFAYDRDWRYTYLNERALSRLQSPREQIIGHSVWEIFPEQVGTPAYHAMQEAMNEGRTTQFELYVPYSDHWIAGRVYPKPEGVSMFCQDITDRKKAEIEATRKNRMVRMLRDSNQALIRITDEQALLNEVCRIAVEVGEYLLAWVGFSEADSKKSIRPVAKAGLDKRYVDSLSLTWAETGIGLGPGGTAIRTGEPVYSKDLQAWHLTPPSAKELGYQSLVAVPLRSAERTFGALFVYAGEKDAFDAEDIQSLTELAGDLSHGIMTIRVTAEHLQAERQKAQLEAQLREAQKIEAIGTLAGGIAHDFNNILGTILGNVELATEDSANNFPVLESLDQIRAAAHRARDLTQQILMFGRRHPLSRTVLDLRPVVENCVLLLRSTLPARIRISHRSNRNAPQVEGDSNQLLQVLVNLGTNAAHAIGEGSGEVEFLVRSRIITDRDGSRPAGLAPGSYAQISVRDTGKGMDRETISRIFEPFYTTKRIGEGTGLGLSVVHGIVQSHGGFIDVSSRPGHGSTFNLYFPASLIVPPPGSTGHPKGAVNIVRGKHVLCIDDDDAMAVLIERMLTRRGFTVTVHTSAESALEAVRSSPNAFDAVISDFNMPGMSGLEVAREVLKLAPELPIALASGYITDELREQSQEAGIRELIYKPNAPQDYVSALDRMLSQTE